MRRGRNSPKSVNFLSDFCRNLGTYSVLVGNSFSRAFSSDRAFLSVCLLSRSFGYLMPSTSSCTSTHTIIITKFSTSSIILHKVTNTLSCSFSFNLFFSRPKP
ncbi:hypothetical protein MtrunA17_Chr8g0367841 [Medicago truncatula]|uniref:Uncharacterized protein n=1 Tax=Medicago truncatula TaxID=3880 RepID=A0A396GS57_MEDTR|nr:hypothetical protein MtrunA17_Chr8g0367841 [Medicago truncatula]